MLNILFVCMGNICRSPLAEGTFRQQVERRGLSGVISCDSAGTHSYHIGQQPNPPMLRTAERHGLKLDHCCRRLTGEDFARFPYIVAMDSLNLSYIQSISYRALGIHQPDHVAFLLRRFDPLAADGDREVPDPYGQDDAAFEKVYQIVWRSTEHFLDFLIAEHGLTPAFVSTSTDRSPV
jgi:protein-tyrosine phosphatase